jgi:hypothetical protein
VRPGPAERVLCVWTQKALRHGVARMRRQERSYQRVEGGMVSPVDASRAWPIIRSEDHSCYAFTITRVVM